VSSEGRCTCGRFGHITDAAALAAADWMGRGDGAAGEAAARAAMVGALAEMPVRLRVVACKGGAQAGPLQTGMEFGGEDPESQEVWDLVPLPLEGMAPLARGIDGALSMLAAGPPGSLMPVPEMYMQKIMVAGKAASAVDLDAPVAANLKGIAAALGRTVEELIAVVLDRPRHEDLVAQIKQCGARLRLIPDGDISAGIAAASRDAGADVCIGIGGSIEAVIVAAALRCLGGELQARFWPVSRHQVEQVRAAGIDDIEAKLSAADLAGEGVVFVATAVTRGRFLRGVEVRDDGVRTETMVMCSRCHAIRTINALHRAESAGHRVTLSIR
jgi:fructose-1,6-bisphosphatase II